MFRDLQESQTAFTDIAAHVGFAANLAYEGRTSSSEGLLVSGSYFPVLELQPALGRLLDSRDDKLVGESRVVVLKRARIYHVRHRELYEAIGDAESRLRRPPTVPRALERIMLPDVILKEPDLVWLPTSEEKMTHVSAFTAITKDSLPQIATPQGSYEPVRYFPDQVPIGIHPDRRWIVVCLLTQDARRELRTFLERHLMFLAALPTWTIRVIIPAHMTA